MRKEDMTALDLILEAVGIVAALLYFCLQIYFGVLYRTNALQMILNLLIFFLIYAGLTLLQIYPERVNGLSREVCSGKIRKYTIHMVRDIKLVFICSLLFTSVCDVMGSEVDGAYSLIVVGIIFLLAVYFEVKIIRVLRQRRKK